MAKTENYRTAKQG